MCGNFSDEDPCRLCSDPARDGSLVCVVEQPGDVIAFERTGQFRGRYHVLGGALSPLDGTHPEDLRIQRAARTPAAGDTVQGDHPRHQPQRGGRGDRALPRRSCWSPLGVRVTRIARGVPMGSDLEYSGPGDAGPRARGAARGRVAGGR